MATVLFHYHLFKNAGTSLDSILKKNFGPRWVTEEFPPEDGNNTLQVEAWMEANPSAVVFSSHTAMGPLPHRPNITVIPLVFMREPVARIISAYQFEAKQAVDNFSTRIARSSDLEGYVRTRLNICNDRQCRNFHTSRLSKFLPGLDPEIERACRAVDMIIDKGVLGIVESFDESMQRIAHKIHPSFPEFHWSSVHQNVSKKEGSDLSQELEHLLQEVNADDYMLLDYAKKALSRVGT